MSGALDALILDIGGTLVVEAAPGTPTAHLDVQLLPGVLDDLRVLASSVRLAAATNTAVMREPEVRVLLGPSGLAELLEVIVTSCDVGAAKPDPLMLQTVLTCLGNPDPSRVLFVGDLATDEEAARAAGIAYEMVRPDGIAATVAEWVARGQR